MTKQQTRSATSGELHELGLAAAARAIRNREVSSETYVRKLLERVRAHADLKAFITIDEASVLQATRQADRSLRAGRSAPLLGVPLAVKDSYLTKGLTTTFGTSVLATFMPTRDALAVARVKNAGAIVFGKNNLVEMSYGPTGLNEHHGQLKNPYNPDGRLHVVSAVSEPIPVTAFSLIMQQRRLRFTAQCRVADRALHDEQDQRGLRPT